MRAVLSFAFTLNLLAVYALLKPAEMPKLAKGQRYKFYVWF
jgi:hypothetical protein